MPPTPFTLGSGNQGSTQPCSSLRFGYETTPSISQSTYTGVFPNKEGSWQQASKVYVMQSGEWREPQSMYVMRNGTWSQTSTELVDTNTRTNVKLRMCGGFEVAGDFGGNSYMQYFTPSQLYVPAGWKIKTIRYSGRYDVICDGIYLTQSTELATSLGQTKRKALILCRRSSTTYVGRNTSAQGNVSSPGPQPTAFEWNTPTWAATNLPNGQGGNMQAVNLYTPNAGASMCGGVDGPRTLVPLTIPSNFTLPFPIDQFVSVRYSGECGGKNRYCNHYTCDNSSYLEFESP
jgi:hypothetical protein